MKRSLPGSVSYLTLPITYAYVMFLTVLILAGCSANNITEEKIREFISNAEIAIEEGNIRKVGNLIDDTYNDSRGRGKKELIQYVTYQVLRKRSIHLYTSIKN